MAVRNIEYNEARKLLRPDPPVFKDMINFPPLQPAGNHPHFTPQQEPPPSDYSHFTEEQGRNKGQSSYSLNKKFRVIKHLNDSDSVNYVKAVKSVSFKDQKLTDSGGGDVPQPTSISVSDFHDLCSIISQGFNNMMQKLDDQNQSQLYVVHNAPDSPVELPEYPSQETGVGISLKEL